VVSNIKASFNIVNGNSRVLSMKRTAGTYVLSSTAGESTRAFVPHALPPSNPPLDVSSFDKLNRDAEQTLGRLAGMAALVPSVPWLLYGSIRKEALLTSQIEGTQATLVDLFSEEAGLVVDNADDVEEVTNYLRAFRFVQKNLRSDKGLPMSVRLWCNAHRLLLDGARGSGKQPGELRRSQNWIGGTRPANASFVPPPPEKVAPLLADLEQFIHQTTPNLSPLVKVALIHAQFETIHPFLDGNGRIGRLLIAALLEQWQLLPEPLVYVSGYLKQHQAEYYRLLSGISNEGDWEAWVAFFLEGLISAAEDAQRRVVKLVSLVTQDRRRLVASPDIGAASYRLFEMLPEMPIFTTERVKEKLKVTFPTAGKAVQALEKIGIVKEVTGKRKGRVYGYLKYREVLEG
jgi:Fic family protein